MDYKCVFKRYEQKYLLTKEQCELLKGPFSRYMREDQYGKSTICNIYYDTDDYRLARASAEKPIYKEKLRLRSYGVPAAGGTVFLEIKKKYKGVVYKRRVPMRIEEARGYLGGGRREPAYCDRQIINEMNWFLDFYRPGEKAFIAYERVSMFGADDGELRITLDENIRWRDTELDLAAGDYGRTILDRNYVLMEVKIPAAMPMWLCRELDKNKIYPVSYSKYGECYKNYILNGMSNEWRGVIYA